MTAILVMTAILIICLLKLPMFFRRSQRPTSQCPYRLHYMLRYRREVTSNARLSNMSVNLDRTMTRTTRASASKMLESINLKSLGKGFSDT